LRLNATSRRPSCSVELVRGDPFDIRHDDLAAGAAVRQLRRAAGGPESDGPENRVVLCEDAPNPFRAAQHGEQGFTRACRKLATVVSLFQCRSPMRSKSTNVFAHRSRRHPVGVEKTAPGLQRAADKPGLFLAVGELLILLDKCLVLPHLVDGESGQRRTSATGTR